MAVKAVILDLDGTLLNGVKPVPETPEMISAMQASGLKIAIASNKSDGAARAKDSGLAHHLFLSRSSVGASKGSPKWVEKVTETFDIESNEVVWLGDSDNDMRSAVNGSVIYFHAGWSVPSYPYGIPISKPLLFPLILRECFQKSSNWYWTLSTIDPIGRDVMARAMLDGNGAGIPSLRNNLLSFLKDGGNPRVGMFSVRDLMILHLIGSIYGEGLFRTADIWAVYPGSKGGTNKALEVFANMASRLFKDKYLGNLLIRHTNSMDSGLTRWKGMSVTFENQINTVNLNPEFSDRIDGKVVVLVDDFTTRGYSSECARNLLLCAGAKDVMCVSISKYGLYQSLIAPIEGYSWNPFTPTTHENGQFVEIKVSGDSDSNGLTVVRESYQRIAKT
ncbi:MAG: hypothetical protein OJF50_000941 [Nitrospira sp.]|nr:hypothetical protein [Nitrospira sp.]